MKILMVLPCFYPALNFGGSVRVAYDVSRELVKRGHEVVVYTSDIKDTNLRTSSDTASVDGVKVHYFKNISMFLAARRIFITPSMIPAIKKNLGSFDVVHIHEYTTFQNLILYNYLKKKLVPYVMHAHGGLYTVGIAKYLKTAYDLLIGHRMLRDASKVISLSWMESEQYRDMGVPVEKIELVPNGIDLSEYTNLPLKGSFREKFNIDEEKKIILFLGRINRLKGIDFLVNTYAYMIKNLKYDDAILVIAGPDDGYLQETKKLARLHRIESRILFTGPLFGTRKVEAYVDASVVASLDSLKGVVFLLVPLEAAACGTPVIVTRSNYIAQLVEKEKFGFWVHHGDVQKLANVLKEMLTREDLLREMGSNGRKFVFENFSWSDKVDRLEKMYGGVIDERKNSKK